MNRLSVIILTFNEAMHIERAVRSVQPFAADVFIIDSGSTDDTIAIAERLGCHVLRNPWVNYATQVNWALQNCPVRTGWVMRLDADEWVNEELAVEINARLADLPADVTGIRVRRRMVFFGRWIRHGGVGERLMLRIWRHGRGMAEQRWMDEHIVLDGGRVVSFRGAITDENLNSLTWWTDKHNRYASREAIDYLVKKHSDVREKSVDGLDVEARRIRFLKQHLYYRCPSIARSTLLFFYRYLLLLGFLDGKAGVYFHFFQTAWYRTLVDAKVYEVEGMMRREGVGLAAAVRSKLGFEIHDPASKTPAAPPN